MPKNIKTNIENISGSNKNNNIFGSHGSKRMLAEKKHWQFISLYGSLHIKS